MTFTPEYTIRYKTYLKATLWDGMKAVFTHHPDVLLRTDDEQEKGVNVALEFPKQKNRYPAVVVKYYEQSITNMGVGHTEEIYVGDDAILPSVFAHFTYKGSADFTVYGLSNYDRDVISDTVVQTLTMPTIRSYTRYFYDVLYARDSGDALGNFININSDSLMPLGDQELPVPWESEDDKLYQSSYRVEVFGEFYSPVPASTVGGLVSEVDLYPYIEDIENTPEGANDPGEWV